MRVPSVGLSVDERRIVREGYRLAERMLAGYEDRPRHGVALGRWLAQLRMLVLARD